MAIPPQQQQVHLASLHVLVQLERPLCALFNGSPHQPLEVAAVADHFLDIVRGGVLSGIAPLVCALTLEQLFIAYGVLLFVQPQPFTQARCARDAREIRPRRDAKRDARRSHTQGTPTTMQHDLFTFDTLLAKHCPIHLASCGGATSPTIRRQLSPSSSARDFSPSAIGVRSGQIRRDPFLGSRCKSALSRT